MEFLCRHGEKSVKDRISKVFFNAWELSVTSKKSGMITELYVEVGDEVQSGATIADVRDSSIMELTVPFNSSDVSSFSVGSSATVTMDSSFETLTGTVTAIDAADTRARWLSDRPIRHNPSE